MIAAKQGRLPEQESSRRTASARERVALKARGEASATAAA